jgi:ribose 5-phosphate isomerase
MNATLDALPGVLAHGIFQGMASEIIVASPSGVRRIKRG